MTNICYIHCFYFAFIIIIYIIFYYIIIINNIIFYISPVWRSSDRSPRDRPVSRLSRSIRQPPQLRLEDLCAGGNRDPSETKLLFLKHLQNKHFKF